MKSQRTLNANLIAPCGMNCNLCSAYLAWTHSIPKAKGKISHCRGCGQNGKACAYLKKWCKPLRNEEVRFCYQCSNFPCHRLRHIDERYRSRYSVSFIENLESIRQKGLKAFVRSQKREFTCSRCRTDVISIHNRKCFRCEKIRSCRG